MPNIKSAIKRAKTSEKSRLRNPREQTQLKTGRRGELGAGRGAEAPKTMDAYRAFCSGLDKAVKHGIIKKNNATRRKARAAALLRKATAK